MKDMFSKMDVITAFKNINININSTIAGVGVDTGLKTNVLALISGDNSGVVGLLTPNAFLGFEHNDESTDPGAPWEAVPDEFLAGDPANEVIDVIDITHRLCYVGHKRYVRVTVTTDGTGKMLIYGFYALINKDLLF